MKGKEQMKAIITIEFPKDKDYDPQPFRNIEVQGDSESLSKTIRAFLDMGATKIVIERKDNDNL